MAQDPVAGGVRQGAPPHDEGRTPVRDAAFVRIA